MKHNSFPLFVASGLLLAVAGCSDDDDAPVEMVNKAPVVMAVSLTTQTDTPVSASIDAIDPEGDALTYTLVDMPSSGMVEVMSDGQFIYTPNSEVTGSDSFTVDVSDGTNAAVNASVNLTIEVLTLGFTESARSAFAQQEQDTPVSVNGREFTADAQDNSFDDLIDQ